MIYESIFIFSMTFITISYIAYVYIRKVRISDFLVPDNNSCDEVDLTNINIHKVWIEASKRNELGEEGPIMTYSYDAIKNKKKVEVLMDIDDAVSRDKRPQL